MKLLLENWREYLNEGKTIVKLYTDPNYYGAEVDEDAVKGRPSVSLDIKDLVGFEPDEKMEDPKSAAAVENIKNDILAGKDMPPILVRKYGVGYQVLDGHHRFHGHKKAGEEEVKAIIIPDDEIEEVDKEDIE
jgi:ParB-like chromosome segregation protein Spo0J|tara:strand:- start:23 stop:421 length:399 start_codon:yes stop_codon:yes gene_type:complete